MSNINQLMEEYVCLLIKRGEALEEGNSKKANRYFDRILSLNKKMRELENYSEEMKKLLTHQEDYVKLDVAFELLPIYTKESEGVLLELSKKPGEVGFTAEWTLEEWEKGNLHKDKN